jgi:hypothetical protein
MKYIYYIKTDIVDGRARYKVYGDGKVLADGQTKDDIAKLRYLNHDNVDFTEIKNNNVIGKKDNIELLNISSKIIKILDNRDVMPDGDFQSCIEAQIIKAYLLGKK